MPTPEQPKPRVLLIGWDAADWIVLHQLIDAGRMPHLARFVERGVIGNLASLVPCLSPMLWTSIATGRTADQHGILGFVEPRADGLGVVPVRRTSRRTKALWNMLDDAGLRSCVIAWPVSDPVEPISGVYVSERLTDNLATDPSAIGPAPEGCVHPPTLEHFLSELRLHPCELAPGDLRGMLPSVDSIDLAADPRPAQLAALLARCATVHAVATTAMEAEPWDFFAVYYDTLDRAGHDFMSYRAPHQSHISEHDFHHYQHVIDGLYEFHDAMLGRLLELAGPDTTVLLVSDHGFHSGARRPIHQGRPGVVPAEGAEWHRMLGVLAMQGPAIRQDERIYGATLLDIAPTVLNLFHLPVGRDMAGRVLTGAFAETPDIRWTNSWETPAAAPLPEPPANLDEREASVRQLVALGYLCAEAVEGAQAARTAQSESEFNLALVHLHHGRPADALPLLEALCQRSPGVPRYQLCRLDALSRLSRHQEVLDLIEQLQAAFTLPAQCDLLAAAAHAALGRPARALELLIRAAAREPGNPIVHQVSGDFHLARGRLADAKAAYQRAVELDSDNTAALSGLAQVHLDFGEYEDAAECALACLQQAFFNPQAHFRLGQAMSALGRRAEARRALQNAVEQAPNYGEAHYRLAEIAEADGDLVLASDHRRRAMGGLARTTP